MIASIHELFKAFSGGQFEPVYTGQFQPVRGGQFKSVGGGQFHRFLQIHYYLHENIDSIAFEIIDPEKINESDVIELFTRSKAKNIILLCNELEVDSQFKSLMKLRNRLSLEQFSEFNILILSSIRENILSRQQKNKSYKNFHIFNLNLRFNKTEASDFIEKLNASGLVKYNDVTQKNKLINRVISDYNGEPYISLLGLINNQDNHLEIILEDAYKQLSDKGKDAVLYTALLYQFKIHIPASILMAVVSKNWEDFIDEIMVDDCKGILIQEILPNNGTEPDLYFRVKHSLLAERLINSILKSEDKLYEKVRKLLSIIHETDYTSKMVVNLLKALRDSNKLNQEKVNKLYDFAAKEFDSNQHFNLHYAINLQMIRRDVGSLKTALNRLSFSGDMAIKRNHRIIHRRASINFDLVKVYYELEKVPEYEHYINEARELFEIKRIEDPCSSYSYCDYIAFEIWCLTHINYDESDYLRQHILIQDLFDVANQTVFEDLQKIADLKVKYLKLFKDKKIDGIKTIKQYIDELYEKEDTRPFALVLKFNYLCDEGKTIEAELLIDEMKFYKHIDDITKILFKYYGRNLHITQNIVNFFEIVKSNPALKFKEKLRYHFFSYVAESYNRAFKNTYDHLHEIKIGFSNLNPEVSKFWLDTNSEKRKFDAILIKNSKERYQAKIMEFQQSFYFRKSQNQIKFIENKKCSVYLIFTLKGIRAEIINTAV